MKIRVSKFIAHDLKISLGICNFTLYGLYIVDGNPLNESNSNVRIAQNFLKKLLSNYQFPCRLLDTMNFEILSVCT